MLFLLLTCFIFFPHFIFSFYIFVISLLILKLNMCIKIYLKFLNIVIILKADFTTDLLCIVYIEALFIELFYNRYPLFTSAVICSHCPSFLGKNL